jgi:hypothetical protein
VKRKSSEKKNKNAREMNKNENYALKKKEKKIQQTAF